MGSITQWREDMRLDAGVSGQQWREIRREVPRPASLESEVAVPVLQAVTVAGAVTVCAWASLVALGAPASFVAAVAVGAGVAAGGLSAAFRAARETQWTTEQYLGAAAQQAAGSVASTTGNVNVSVAEYSESGQLQRIVNEQLGVRPEMLARAIALEELSVRALTDEGMKQNEAQRLLSELIGAGFLFRSANNAPAVWTSSGRALRREMRALPVAEQLDRVMPVGD